MEIVIDLLWVRTGKVGGTEVYIRNLLDGFMENKTPIKYVLLTTKDNSESFQKYLEDEKFIEIIAPIYSANIVQRVLWQSFLQNKFLRKRKYTKCFSPVLYRPLFNGGITYINVIHDIQAKHFPQYHPLHEVLYSKLCWQLAFKKSKKIIVISNFVKRDILEHYKVKAEKINVIYNAVEIEKPIEELKEKVLQKYKIKEKDYFYTVSQLIPHKNLDVLLRVIKKIKEDNINLPCKLLISGMNSIATKALNDIIDECGIRDNVCLTGYITNEERNILYANCHTFLFPSIFEGFGIPPVEAMMHGATVVTTKETCIPEVTQNMANYVDEPFNESDWIDVIKNAVNQDERLNYCLYMKRNICSKYIKVILDNI